MEDKKIQGGSGPARSGNITMGNVTGNVNNSDINGGTMSYQATNYGVGAVQAPFVAAPANILPDANEVIVDSKIKYNVGSLMKNSEMVFKCFLERKETALKKIAISDVNLENVTSDIEKLKDKTHDNVVQYLYKAEKGNFFYIAMDLVEGRESLMESEEDYLKGIDKKKFLMEITNGLKFLHDKGVVHGALDPSNILLYKSKKIVHPKLFNYALKKVLSNDAKNYAAPEVVSGGERTFSSDIFSLCGIFYFVLSDGDYPFSYGKKGGKMTCKFSGEGKTLFQENVDFSCFARDLINKMKADKPDDRPTIDVVLKDPYFWTGEEVMNLLTIIHSKNDGQTECFKEFKKELNKKADSIFGPATCDWTDKIEKDLKDNINVRLRSPLSSVSDLVLAIRNKHHHREDPNFQAILKNTLEKSIQNNSNISKEGIAASHLTYWGVRFPELLTKLYQEYLNHFTL